MNIRSAAAGSALWRFFAHGVREAESRGRRLTEPSGAHDADLITVLEESAVARATTAVDAHVEAAWSTSRTRAALRPAIGGWRWGPTLLIAVTAHVAMTLSQPTVGWLWAIVPALVAVAALLLVVSERS